MFCTWFGPGVHIKGFDQKENYCLKGNKNVFSKIWEPRSLNRVQSLEHVLASGADKSFRILPGSTAQTNHYYQGRRGRMHARDQRHTTGVRKKLCLFCKVLTDGGDLPIRISVSGPARRFTILVRMNAIRRDKTKITM